VTLPQVATAAAETDKSIPSLPSRRVQVLTRRPAMADCLARHLAALNLEAVGDGESAELVVVDASGHQDYLRTRATAITSSVPLVVIATTAEIESRKFDSLVASDCIVLKPVQRATLGEALAAALGLAPAPAVTARTLSTPEPLVGHVLLVEDEPVNATVAQGYLEALGCTSVWVKDGPEAVARTAVERFDLIFMDLSMPTMDGYATTALIRQRDAGRTRVPIIALSAHDAATYRERCLQAGMDDMLSKPYTLEACAQLLARWLHGDAPSQSLQTGLTELAGIDTQVVASLRKLRPGTSADLYSQLVEMFKTGSVHTLAQLGSAMNSADWSAAAALCHKLKASAANVGALAYSRELLRIEEACLTGDRDQAHRLHARIQSAHPALLAGLHELTLRASA
jgi:two-component system sensor histidine kinase/response regulator